MLDLESSWATSAGSSPVPGTRRRNLEHAGDYILFQKSCSRGGQDFKIERTIRKSPAPSSYAGAGSFSLRRICKKLKQDKLIISHSYRVRKRHSNNHTYCHCIKSSHAVNG